MVIGTAEGNLKGIVTINLSRKINLAKYKVTFEVRADDGSFYKILPSFPVFHSESFVYFRNTEEWESLYMKVTVEFISEPSSAYVEKECNECASLNNSWKPSF